MAEIPLDAIGVQATAIPLTPERVWRALKGNMR